MKRIVAGIATFAMLLNVTTPVFAATSLEIVGNGSDSDNSVDFKTETQTAVTQTNNSNITNNVNASSSTGGNSASKNTSGNVQVSTGDAATVVSVENAANSNSASVTGCNGCDADAEVKISGNGADSENDADLRLEDSTALYQTNSGSVVNKVNADAYTGDNRTSKNTGGDVEVSTGDSFTHVGLTTHANSNIGWIGGEESSNGGVSLLINENGADSENDIWLKLDHDVLLTQRNNSYVKNWVDADSSTGSNKAGKNTGGSVLVETGDALSEVLVDNAANFNWADLDCDCLTDVSAKVAGNGADSENKIKARLEDDRNIFQDNSCELNEVAFFFGGYHGKCGLNNNLNADSATGDNDAKSNTGDPGADPEITTGDAETVVVAENAGNSNTYGSDLSDPEWDFGGLNFNISFDLSDLLGALGIH